MDDVKKTVTVEALEDHTAFGESYKAGDVYEIPEEFADTVVIQKKAKRVGDDRHGYETAAMTKDS